MQTRHDDLRDELVAILGAGRELSPDADRQLADAFVRYLEHEDTREVSRATLIEAPHQPHYSLVAAGFAWGASLMFLLLLLLLGNPNTMGYMLFLVLFVAVLAALTRGFLYMARYGWRFPRVTVAPPPPQAKRRA